MAVAKRVVVSVSDQLLREINGVVAMELWNRSALIREAVRTYLEERKKRDMREQMKRGYREMARINLTLAEEGLMFEAGVFTPSGSRRDE